MTTWRDLRDELTLRQTAELAQGESLGYCDEALLLYARDFASCNLDQLLAMPAARRRRPRP